MNEEYVMTPREYDRYLDGVQLERDAALARAETAEKELADCEGMLFEEGVTEATIRAEKAEAALRSITKPGGAYSRDKEQYFKNIIEWCIETAEEALATTPEPTEENRYD